jgi:hypothetical protein
MSDLVNLIQNLSLEDNKNIIRITSNEIGIGNIKNYNLISEFTNQIETIKRLLSIGTIFSNKEMIISMLRFKWIFDKIIESILRTSTNYSHDISSSGLDKTTPEILISHLKNNLSKEQFNLIYINYLHYQNKFC